MRRTFKKIILWVRRSSHLPLIIIGSVVVLLLFFNEDTSIARNMEYENRIRELKAEIKLNRDSAAIYRAKREAILYGREDLEHLAREQYNMQRPTEDVYILDYK